MLVFSAICPHPAMAIPTASPDISAKIKKTISAFNELEESLYTCHPDLIISLTSSDKEEDNNISINFSKEYEVDLKDFGDLTTKNKFLSNIEIPNKLYEQFNLNNLNSCIVSDEKLNYKHSIPLIHLLDHLPNIKILPIEIGKIDHKAALKAGEILRDIILVSNKRIAVIVSGNLSNALTSESPAGYNQNGEKFDFKFRELLKHKNLSGLIQTDEIMINESAQKIYNQALVFLSLIQNINTTYTEMVYEAPFGVGLLTANYKI